MYGLSPQFHSRFLPVKLFSGRYEQGNTARARAEYPSGIRLELFPGALRAVDGKELLAPVDHAHDPARGCYGRDFASAEAARRAGGVVHGAVWPDQGGFQELAVEECERKRHGCE